MARGNPATREGRFLPVVDPVSARPPLVGSDERVTDRSHTVHGDRAGNREALTGENLILKERGHKAE